MSALLVRRHRDAGRFERLSKSYRPIPCRQRVRARPPVRALRAPRRSSPRAPIRVRQALRAVANSSPRLASITASRSSASIPAASAASDDTGRSGSPAACASARAVATPMRRPVNAPGPTPTAIASRSSQPSPARSITSATAGISSLACAGRAAEALGSGRDLERRAVGAQHAGARRRGGGVEAEQAHSIVIRRRSSPTCSSRTRAATRRSSGSATAGHSTNATRSSVR